MSMCQTTLLVHNENLWGNNSEREVVTKDALSLLVRWRNLSSVGLLYTGMFFRDIWNNDKLNILFEFILFQNDDVLCLF